MELTDATSFAEISEWLTGHFGYEHPACRVLGVMRWDHPPRKAGTTVEEWENIKARENYSINWDREHNDRPPIPSSKGYGGNLLWLGGQPVTSTPIEDNVPRMLRGLPIYIWRASHLSQPNRFVFRIFDKHFAALAVMRKLKGFD